jgi:hypothetical protein
MTEVFWLTVCISYVKIFLSSFCCVRNGCGVHRTLYLMGTKCGVFPGINVSGACSWYSTPASTAVFNARIFTCTASAIRLHVEVFKHSSNINLTTILFLYYTHRPRLEKSMKIWQTKFHLHFKLYFLFKLAHILYRKANSQQWQFKFSLS